MQGHEPLAEEMTVGAVHERVNGLENRFDRFQESIESSFREVNANIASIAKDVGQRFETSRPDVYKMAGVLSVALVLAGAYFQLEKSNIDDHNTFTNDRIAMTNVALTALVSNVDKFGDKVDKRFERLTDLTIPKEELNSRLALIRETQQTKVDKDVFAKAADMRDDQIKALREGQTELRANQVSRDELKYHWEDQGIRFKSLSDRLTNLETQWGSRQPLAR